ncbi:matrixin family metalloprotease [Micromonospora sp. IBHARD004]|uniref:matrixin family metalloprotease n=1 Tax=Micromonospora sp. IBHARD004 TaxID=3457764 RepID=UPI00405990FD
MIKRALTALTASGMLLTIELATGAVPASAYATFNGHKLIYGVGNYGSSTQHYWVDSSASAYSGTIDTAMDNWIYTTSYWGITTPISYTRTSVKSSSRMDHYKVSTINSWWGLTQMFSGSTQINPSTANWVWAKVLLDGDYANCPNKKGVIAHEQGHSMGLAHVYSGTAVMRSDIADLSTNRATPDDLNGINYLY